MKYTMRHPICGTITHTDNPVTAWRYKQAGWDVHKHHKVYKHSND